MADKNRMAALEALKTRVNKGMPGGVSTLSEQPPLAMMSSGALTLDAGLIAGGWVRGACHMIYGIPKAGKTALVLLGLADKMRKDPDALTAWIDIEHTLRREWVTAFGIDTDRVVMMEASTSEEAVNLMQSAVRENIFDYVVVDSIGAMARSVEVDGTKSSGAKAKKADDGNASQGDANTAVVGGSAALIGRMLRVANAEIIRLSRRRIAGEPEIIEPAIMLVNQARADMDSKYAGAIDFAGGFTLEHMLATIVRVTASGKAENILYGTDSTGKKVQVGSLVTARVEKNKFGPSPREATYWFCYQGCPEHEFGVNTVLATIDTALQFGLIRQGGAWYYVGDEKFHGYEPLREYLIKHPEIISSLRKGVLEQTHQELVDGVVINDES